MTDALEDIRIKSWEHFNKVCLKLEGYGSGSTDTVIFRGCRDAGWELIPSLYWKLKTLQIDSQQIHEIEREFIDRFKQKWFFDEMKSYIEHTSLFPVLYIMQHYGIKTRMLDWTLSWKVAAYFATESDPKFDGKDAAVWCINRAQIENRFEEFCGEQYKQRSLNRGISSLNNYNLCLKNKNECPVKQPNSQIQCNAIFFKDVFSSSTDARMIIQASVFTYCPNPLLDHIECINKVLVEDTEKYCKKMIIPKELKREFRSELDRSEYTREKLYSEGVEKWCKETFLEILAEYQKN